MDAPVPTTPAVTRFATESLSEPDWRWAVEAGAGALGAFAAEGGGLGPEFVPVARVERAFGRRWCARVSFAGLGTQARVDTPGGYADVSETVILADLVARFRRGRRLEPSCRWARGRCASAPKATNPLPMLPVRAVSGRWRSMWGVVGGFRCARVA